jgi:CRP-like cAMP-binding protein
VEVAHRQLLDRLKAFSEFEAAELDALAGVMHVRRVAAGATLFREGEPADGCYLVADGRVQVTITRNGRPEQLAMLGRGDFIGQMAVLDGGRRSATCTAAESSTVLYLARDDFDRLVRGGSSFALKFVDALTRMLVAQLRYANRRLLALAEQEARAGGRIAAERAAARDALHDVSRRTLSCSLSDVDPDDLEVVVVPGARRR